MTRGNEIPNFNRISIAAPARPQELQWIERTSSCQPFLFLKAFLISTRKSIGNNSEALLRRLIDFELSRALHFCRTCSADENTVYGHKKRPPSVCCWYCSNNITSSGIWPGWNFFFFNIQPIRSVYINIQPGVSLNPACWYFFAFPRACTLYKPGPNTPSGAGTASVFQANGKNQAALSSE